MRGYFVKCTLLLAALPALAQQPQTAPVQAGPSVQIFAGQSKVFTAPWAVQRMAVTNPKVADVEAVSPTQVLLLGRAIGTTDKQETARLLKGLLMTDDLMREKASLLDTLKKSLKPGIPYQVTPEMLRNDADGLAAWQDHYKANSTDPKSQLLDREMRAALAERYGDKVDVVLEAAQRGKYAEDNILAGVMGEKLRRQVRVSTSVDKTLIGGVVMRAADLVIDGSVRGRLAKLSEAMNS